MSMSTHVVGFIPPDAEWKKKKKARDACVEAGVDIPGELDKFFGYQTPDERGREVDLGESLKEYSADMESGYEIELAKLPKEVKFIRFVNSW